MYAPAPRLLGSCAALLGLLACGGAPKDARPEIASVAFDGNETLEDDELEEGLATRGPQGLFGRKKTAFDRRVLDDDKARIERQYRERGYFGASVTDVAIDESQAGEVAVEFQIDEGQPVQVADVRFDGAPEPADVNAAALARVAGIAAGGPFHHPTYLEAKERLLAHLVGRGFAHAEVRGEVRVQPSELRAQVVFDIDAGPRVTFGPLVVSGLKETPLSAIDNRLAWEEGDPYRPELLAITRARLRTLGVFSTVRVDVKREGRPARAPVEITVVESPRNTVRLGGGFAIDRIRRGIRGLAGYTRLGAAGPLTKLRTEVRPGYVDLVGGDGAEDGGGPVIEARVSLEKDDFWWPLLNGLASLDYSIRQIEAYRSQGTTARARLSRTFADGFLYVGFAYQFQLLDFLSINDAIDAETREELGLGSAYRLGLIEQTIALDGRDDSVRPRLGYYAAIRLQQAAAPLASEFSFATATPEVRGFVPLGDRFVVAALLRWSQLLGGDDLPITRRFFGGGATSHRGFAQRRLSPVPSLITAESVPIGGEAMFEGSLEVRFDVAQVVGQTLGLVAFADAGDVTLNASELDPFNSHVAVGGGLRLYTPIGPLRVDVGYRLNRFGPGEPDSGERLSYHLTLGEAF